MKIEMDFHCSAFIHLKTQLRCMRFRVFINPKLFTFLFRVFFMFPLDVIDVFGIVGEFARSKLIYSQYNY